jgi:hypothetical protein
VCEVYKTKGWVLYGVYIIPYHTQHTALYQHMDPGSCDRFEWGEEGGVHGLDGGRHSRKRAKQQRHEKSAGKKHRRDSYGDSESTKREMDQEQRDSELFHLQGDFPVDTFGAAVGAMETPFFDTHSHICERQKNALGSAFSLVMRIYVAKQAVKVNKMLYDTQGKLVTLAQHKGVVVDTTTSVGGVLSFSERSRLQAAALGKFSPGSEDLFAFVMCTRDLRRSMSALKQIKRNRAISRHCSKKKRSEMTQLENVYAFALG